MPNRRYNSQIKRPGFLKGGQAKLDANKDGYVEGGKEIEMTNPAETQEEEVQGQGNILAEKKRKAKWY